MPALAQRRLQQAILDAIAESGAVGFVQPGGSAHPRRVALVRDADLILVWVYIWTLTRGGRKTLPNEYRIQMTAVRSPLPVNPEGPTLLMGYEPNLGMFGGFDLGRHVRFTEGSPSVQIDIGALRDALQNGFAFDRKSNGEIAVGVRPDMFVSYCERAPLLHKSGAGAAAAALLNRASAREALPASLMANLPQQRQRVLKEVSKLSRSANFRQQVLQAYDHRCAVTRMQLRLVEAAHILPVAAGSDSIDHVTNGISLSPTYHTAFDRGLIYLGEDFMFRVNKEQTEHLRSLDLGGGLADFERTLGKIHLPPDDRQWPDVRFVRKANRFRGVRV